MIFPDSYGLLFSGSVNDIQCLSYGGLKYLQQCTNVAVGSTQSIQFLTLKQSIAGLPITLEYYGLVLYPSANPTLMGFELYINYNSITLASQTGIQTKIAGTISKLLDIYVCE